MAQTILAKLAAIQQSISVPKDQYNKFAEFNYRSAEGILEKLKPLLLEQGATLVLTDEIEDHAEQGYVKATARIYNNEDGEFLEATAFAREEKTRPKMSEGQLTGAASSYARKYALNGLLLLDDSSDPDSHDNSTKATTSAPAKQAARPVSASPGYPATDKQRKLINDKLTQIGVADEEKKGYLIEQYGITNPTEMTSKDASVIIESLILAAH